MSKDGPPSGGIRFGNRQAWKAGVPCPRPRSEGDVNIEAFLSRHPELLQRVLDMKKSGRQAYKILYELREEGLDGKFSVDFWINPEKEKFSHTEYSDDREKLESISDRNFANGIYKLMILWEFDAESGAFVEIRRWPEEGAPSED